MSVSKATEIDTEEDDGNSNEEQKEYESYEEISMQEHQQGYDTDEDIENSDSELIRGTVSSTSLNKLTQNYLREIYAIIELKEEVNYKNALDINREMQNRLMAIRLEIKRLHANILKRFAANEEFLKENMKGKRPNDGVYGKLSRGEKFYFKGSIYFRDKNGRNAPNNDDYFQRRNKGEMFPMDFDLTSKHVWSITDKMSIVKAIKEQILCDKKFRKRFKNKNQKLGPMLKQVDNAFEIDWMQICAHDLKHRHSPTSCKAMFEVYLHPALKHDGFNSDENERLAQAVEKYNNQNWAAIAAEVGQRSDYQCFLQYYTSTVFRTRYDRWDKNDDELLMKTVEASKCNGVVNWAQVAYLFPQKSKVSLQQRYKYVLDPVISHEPFTGEEDLLLLAAVQEYGTSFAKFPRSLFPNRSIIQLRARYLNTLQHRHKLCPWTIEDDRILLKFVEEHGMAWKKCAEEMQMRHTRTSCRQRYLVIQKNMEKKPDFKIEDLPRRPHRMISTSVTAENWLEKIELLRANPELSVNETTAPIKRQRARKRKCKTDAEINAKRARENKKTNYIERLRNNGILYHNFLKYGYNFRFGKPTQYTPIGLYMHESQIAIERLGFHVPNTNEAKRYERPKFGSNINGFFMPPQRRIDLANIIKQRIPEGMVSEPDGNQLTPNFSTLIALRALCVLSTDTAKRQEQETNKNNQTEVKENNEVHNVKIEQEEDEVELNLTENLTEVNSKIEIKQEIHEESQSIPNSSFVKKPISDEAFNSLPVINRFRQRFRSLFYQAAVLTRLPPASIPNSKFMEADKLPEGRISPVTSTLPLRRNSLVNWNLTEKFNLTQKENSTKEINVQKLLKLTNPVTPPATTIDVIKQEPISNAEFDDSSNLPFVIKNEIDYDQAISSVEIMSKDFVSSET